VFFALSTFLAEYYWNVFNLTKETIEIKSDESRGHAIGPAIPSIDYVITNLEGHSL
jgi:hypothetical protein